MAAKLIIIWERCVECGKEVSAATLWVDNAGPLCYDCAIIKRYGPARQKPMDHKVSKSM